MDACNCFIHKCQNANNQDVFIVDEWIKYNKTMDYGSVLKRYDLSSHEKIWKELKCILPKLQEANMKRLPTA